MPLLGNNVYVTGIGAVSAAGRDIAENISTMRHGCPALAPPRRFSTKVDSPVGEVSMSDAELKASFGLDGSYVISRTALLGMKAVTEAVADSSARGAAPGGRRIAFISGTSVGGMDLSEVFWSRHRQDLMSGDVQMLRMHAPGAVTSEMASQLEAEGVMGRPVFISTVSTACSAAGNAVMLGARMIRRGLVDMAIVGGVDSLCRFTMNGFNSLRILDTGICRPFDSVRAGLNLGEGAGYLVLSAHAQDPYCRISGWGNANEAYHQTASTPEGVGPGMAMEAALKQAGLAASDVDFINTHGTGTQVNDLAESNAMLRVFGGDVPPFSSLKPFIGHTLGASEGIEAALVCAALESGDVSFMRQAGQTCPMEETGLMPYDGSMLSRPEHVMSSAFGFSGNCVSLIFSRI